MRPGPGDVSLELAKVVGSGGFVHGCDLNVELLDTARQRAQQAGLDGLVQFHHVTDGTIPLADASVDRVVFKSVLLYVPDAAATIREAYRLLRPGGTVVCQDIDFWLTACTAFTPAEWRTFQDAVGPAFSDPNIGRHLRGHLASAGLRDLTTNVTAFVDDRGVFIHTLHNFIGYARAVKTLSEQQRTA